MRTIKTVAAGLFISPAGSTFAHITLEYPEANAGSSYKATFKVGHGYGASPVKQIIVTAPAGVQGSKPMPKAGWAIEIIRDKLDWPCVDLGRSVSEGASRITWTAQTPEDYLPSTHCDEFVRHAKLPATEGTLYWPVSQVSVEGRMGWVEVPRPGQSAAELKAPAPALLPAAGGHPH